LLIDVMHVSDADIVFMVTLSAPATHTVTVDYETADASAIAGADYVESHGSPEFLAGQTTREITVRILGDPIVEREETFALILTHADGAGIAIDHAIARSSMTMVRATAVLGDRRLRSRRERLVLPHAAPTAQSHRSRAGRDVRVPSDGRRRR
jgi:hypothetical protein